MPAKRNKERIRAQYLTWLLGRRNGIYVADGRSNPTDAGRHSLGTRDRQEALELLTCLDAVKAVELSLAPASVLETARGHLVSLEEGRRLYLEHVGRPAVQYGATRATAKRYRPVFDKFFLFAQSKGVCHWQAVTKKLLEAYSTWLDEQNYSYATEYLELTTLKQALGWLVAEGHLPASCRFTLPLSKPHGTTTYCYTTAEVEAMIAHCSGQPGLAWLGGVIVALASTGLRIGELAELRWSDVDLVSGVLQLKDTRFQGSKETRARARTTKGRRGRALPIHPRLAAVLGSLRRQADGRVFHGPRGGRLRPDTVRVALVRNVLGPLANRFPSPPEEKGFRDGRLHSLRHFFCSLSANSGVPEQVLMAWLGHQDSKMVRHYYHLYEEESRRQMARITFEGWKIAAGAAS